MVKIRHSQRGAHVDINIFVGEVEGQLAHAGSLIVRMNEWPRLVAVLLSKQFTLERTSSDENANFGELLLQMDESSPF